MLFIMPFYLMQLSILSYLISLIFLLMNFNLIIEWTMFYFNSTSMNFILFLDWMTMIFSSTVMMITSLVMIYSIEYMNSDIYIKRFMMLIITFASSMILMINSPNMISILLGWDGLGLSSYCLVAYYQNKKSFNSSMITILMNRIGDIMIIMNISLMLKLGSWNFLFFKKINMLMMILMITASITKSAQIPFSTWLPLAMAAPTPISSLVHSSTLVTTGVYLLIRFNNIMNKEICSFLLILSCLTMFMAGSSANFEFDFKKIIALSTLSQLSMMIFSISLKYQNLAFFHLITHAMFKSLLFLCSGIIIHNYFNHQDIRFISMMNINQPFIILTINIASMALMGFPFLAGFYSKDLIIENFLMNNLFNNLIIFMMLFMSMSFTISYSLRLLFYINLKTPKINMMNFYQSKNLMNYSILMLLKLSIIYGAILNWMMFSSLNKIILPINLKLTIYIFMFLGMLLSMIKWYKLKLNKLMIKIYYLFNMMWLLPLMSKKNKINTLKLTNFMIMNMENKWLELLTVKKKLWTMKKIFNKLMKFKMNFMMLFFLTTYMIFMILILI